MSLDTVLYLTRQALLLVLLISAPPVLASLAVGFVMNLVQSVTQVNEPTLHFVPRIVAVFLALSIASPWIISEVVAFATVLFTDFPMLVH